MVSALVFAGCSDQRSSHSAPQRDEIILVTGATGIQGGAVARNLLKRGFKVRGLTRNPQSDKAKEMATLGVKMVKGDFDDPASLRAAMDGAYGVFAVTDFWEHGYQKEIEQGRNLIDAALETDIKHFVFTSVESANVYTGIPHFETKGQIENYLRDSGLPYSIVRPVEFMDNVLSYRKSILAGTYYDPRDSGKTHQWIAASDIGFIVGDAFSKPDTWLGRELDIAGDEMTIAAYVDALSRAFGLDVHHQQITWSAFEGQAGEEITLMMKWFDKKGYSVDIVQLRKEFPELLTYPQYLESLNWD